MLSNSEQAVLAVFRSFQVNTGEMLCFHGPQLERYGATLRTLTEKDLVVKERFAGGYSLTRAGFDALVRPPKSSTPGRKPSAASRAVRPR